MAWLHLEPSRCVIIVGLGSLMLLCLPSRICLGARPCFSKLPIKKSGKYLGWWPGFDSANTSYQDPVDKFVNGVEDTVGGNSPPAISFCRHSRSGVSVLSYVAQFSLTPPSLKPSLPSLDQWAIHKILRIPFNLLPRYSFI